MEKKDIRDYIHLYPRCPIVYDDLSFNKTGIKGVVTPKIIEWAVYPDYNGRQIANVKPYLRKLSSMSEEDCPEWFKEWMPDGFDVFHQRDNSYCYIEIDSKADDGYMLTIHPDGSMNCKCKDNDEQYAYKGAELFRHLLSKSFDLFGLLESGLAISENDIK